MSKFFRHLREVAQWPGMGKKISDVLAMTVVAALFEGTGMAFLVPIVETLQSHGQPARGGGLLSQMAYGAMESAGIPVAFNSMLILGVGFFLFNALANYWRGVWTLRTQNMFQEKIQTRLFGQICASDLAFFQSSRTGDIAGVVVTEANRAAYSLRLVLEMSAAVFVLSLYVMLQLLFSWKMTLCTLPVLAAVGYALRPRKTYTLGVELSAQNQRISTLVHESLSGIREIHVLGLQPLLETRFGEAIRRWRGLDNQINVSGQRFTLLYQSVLMVVVAFLVTAGANLFHMPFSALVVYLVILQRMTPRVYSFLDRRHWWLGTLGAVETINRMLARTAPRASGPAGQAPVAAGSDIEFKNVSFAYAGREGEVLRGVDARVPHNKLVAVVGPSGAGKSTLLDLLARFADPTQGEILVGGKPLAGVDAAAWRRGLGYVGQETFLFNDTIENNVRMGRLDATAAEVQDAARLAFAHDFVAAMPQGYQTLVGDRGAQLSGGQRQRLALARALLRAPRLLLLDEVTSGLDPESERSIRGAIQGLRARATVVIVTHRPSLVESSDWVIVVDGRTVLDQGAYAEVFRAGNRHVEFLREGAA